MEEAKKAATILIWFLHTVLYTSNISIKRFKRCFKYIIFFLHNQCALQHLVNEYNYDLSNIIF